VTRFGTIRLRIARTREKSFLPVGLRRFQRRAEEVSLLIREAFLRGISTRQVGRVVATITGEAVSAQTVSKLTRDLDEAVRQFHQARLRDDYVYLFLDGFLETPENFEETELRCSRYDYWSRHLNLSLR
jgi:putative transposase